MLFVSLISVAVLRLTPRTEIGRVAQASITVFVASIPYIISVISSDVSNTKLHKLDIENRLKEFVQSYLKESESTGDEETEDTFEYVSASDFELGQRLIPSSSQGFYGATAS